MVGTGSVVNVYEVVVGAGVDVNTDAGADVECGVVAYWVVVGDCVEVTYWVVVAYWVVVGNCVVVGVWVVVGDCVVVGV